MNAIYDECVATHVIGWCDSLLLLWLVGESSDWLIHGWLDGRLNVIMGWVIGVLFHGYCWYHWMDRCMDCWMDHRMNVDKSLDGLLDWFFDGLGTCGPDGHDNTLWMDRSSAGSCDWWIVGWDVGWVIGLLYCWLDWMIDCWMYYWMDHTMGFSMDVLLNGHIFGWIDS